MSWRFAPWIIAALALLLPVVAIQLTNEVSWDKRDFILVTVMLLVSCGTWELAARKTASTAYRCGVAITVSTAFLLIWINLAVGMIGSEDNPANLMFDAVLAIGVIGALLARFRPRGMTRALAATAVAQALVGVVALIAGLGPGGATGSWELISLTVIFAAGWLLAAWLFGKAGRNQSDAGAPGRIQA